MPKRLTRRRFLKLTAVSTVNTVLVGTGLLGYSAYIEPGWFDTEHVHLRLPRLSPAFAGYRIAQISDIHLDGAFMTRERLIDIAHRVNELQPDLVALTGDFVTYRPADFAGDLIAGLSRLQAPDGAFAVLGNHDHWTKARTVRDILARSGVRNLDNEVVTLRRGSEVLHICGVDDYWERESRLDRVLDDLPEDGPAILLAHEPDFADISAATGRFDLQLSGHSHGGQVDPLISDRRILPPYAKKYPIGLYHVGGMIQYTNRGVGMTHPRLRFNCRPEITLFTFASPTGGS